MKILMALMMMGTLASCSVFQKKPQQNTQGGTSSASTQQMQTENKNQKAFEQASKLASGWPETSVIAAKEIISKYGEPSETTSNMLIWRNVAPFREIIVHRNVYSHQFPLLHKNAVEHKVDYKAPSANKVGEIWEYNGAVSLDRNRGLMSVVGENEAMNILSLNLAHEILSGERSYESARIKYGQETLDFLNGQKTNYTQSLKFGNQRNTADKGKSITDKIQWVSPDGTTKTHRQAQEEQ